MKKVPLWGAILLEFMLIVCHDYFEKPDIWYVIGINAIFIIYAIAKTIYEYNEYKNFLNSKDLKNVKYKKEDKERF